MVKELYQNLYENNYDFYYKIKHIDIESLHHHYYLETENTRSIIISSTNQKIEEEEEMKLVDILTELIKKHFKLFWRTNKETI